MSLNKKGVSLMVSYALLVVISIALGALVYSFLKLYLPSTTAECPADINLAVETFSCNWEGKTLNLTLTNRGLFNVSGVFVRFGEQGRTVRKQINTRSGEDLFIPPLAPGQTTNTKSYYIGDILVQNSHHYILEIQPAIFSRGSLVPCKGAIVTQPVRCTNATLPPGSSYFVLQEDSDSLLCSGIWDAASPCSNVTDGDWNTYGRTEIDPDNDEGILYLNYTTKNNAISTSKWEIKYGSAPGAGTVTRENITLSDYNCWNDTLIQFRLNSSSAGSNKLILECWNGTAFTEIRNVNYGVSIYEEAMWWEIPI